MTISANGEKRAWKKKAVAVQCKTMLQKALLKMMVKFFPHALSGLQMLCALTEVKCKKFPVIRNCVHLSLLPNQKSSMVIHSQVVSDIQIIIHIQYSEGSKLCSNISSRDPYFLTNYLQGSGQNSSV